MYKMPQALNGHLPTTFRSSEGADKQICSIITFCFQGTVVHISQEITWATAPAVLRAVCLRIQIFWCVKLLVGEWFTMSGVGGEHCLYTEALKRPRRIDIICGQLNPYK